MSSTNQIKSIWGQNPGWSWWSWRKVWLCLLRMLKSCVRMVTGLWCPRYFYESRLWVSGKISTDTNKMSLEDIPHPLNYTQPTNDNNWELHTDCQGNSCPMMLLYKNPQDIQRRKKLSECQFYFNLWVWLCPCAYAVPKSSLLTDLCCIIRRYWSKDNLG